MNVRAAEYAVRIDPDERAALLTELRQALRGYAPAVYPVLTEFLDRLERT